jgi:hypothetical protein
VWPDGGLVDMRTGEEEVPSLQLVTRHVLHL